jgi:hypothetical protein
MLSLLHVGSELIAFCSLFFAPPPKICCKVVAENLFLRTMLVGSEAIFRSGKRQEDLRYFEIALSPGPNRGELDGKPKAIVLADYA